MKQLLLIASFGFLLSCNNSGDKKTETTDKKTIEGGSAAAYAAQWCALNERLTRASEGDKETAKAALKQFEKELEDQFKSDEAFMKQIEEEVEKCEDASER